MGGGASQGRRPPHMGTPWRGRPRPRTPMGTPWEPSPDGDLVRTIGRKDGADTKAVPRTAVAAGSRRANHGAGTTSVRPLIGRHCEARRAVAVPPPRLRAEHPVLQARDCFVRSPLRGGLAMTG